MSRVTKRISSDNLDVHKARIAWKQVFCGMYDAFALLLTIRAKNRHSPWMIGDLLSPMYERDRLRRKAIKTKNNDTWEQYKLLRNQIAHSIKQTQ
jgi:hypothetical protein